VRPYKRSGVALLGAMAGLVVIAVFTSLAGVVLALADNHFGKALVWLGVLSVMGIGATLALSAAQDMEKP
jgi:hypothetical protein